jgi:hypothetical protein
MRVDEMEFLRKHVGERGKLHRRLEDAAWDGPICLWLLLDRVRARDSICDMTLSFVKHVHLQCQAMVCAMVHGVSGRVMGE